MRLRQRQRKLPPQRLIEELGVAVLGAFKSLLWLWYLKIVIDPYML